MRWSLMDMELGRFSFLFIPRFFLLSLCLAPFLTTSHACLVLLAGVILLGCLSLSPFRVCFLLSQYLPVACFSA
jgi:hypothetical protein